MIANGLAQANLHNAGQSIDCWMVVFNGFLAFFTLGLWYSTHKLWKSSKRQLDFMEKEFIQTQHPKLRITNVIIKKIRGRGGLKDSFIDSGQLINGQFYITNMGNTPATITGIGCWVEWLRYAGGLPMERPFEGKNGNILISTKLKSGEPLTIPFASEQPMDANAEYIRTGQLNWRLYVMGWVEYVDDIGTPRRTLFCRYWNPAMEKFIREDDSDYESEE
ncbi:MAG: hypothetical protein M0Z61_03020 [Nitrospiraceae bacterium]|nr:hypothetical protein [Nitrospiraceae bacterium]